MPALSKKACCGLLMATVLVHVLNFRSLAVQQNHLELVQAKTLPLAESLTFQRANLLDQGPHLCGLAKCLFRLQTNSSLAYLAGVDASLARTLTTAYHFAQQVIEFYDMRHIYLAPPQTLVLDRTVRQWMDGDRIDFKTGQVKDNAPRFAAHSTATVQLVTLIDDAAVLFGTNDHKIAHGWEQTIAWLSAVTDDRLAVYERFAQNAQQLHELLEDHPCLYYDFQIFVRQNGEMVHLDVDRCFERPTWGVPKGVMRRSTGQCASRVRDFTDFVQQALRTGVIPATRPTLPC